MPTDDAGHSTHPDRQAERLGAALRSRRKRLGISMAAAAEAAGISRVTWHRIEKGEAGVAWRSLLAAAAVLGLQLDWVEADAEATPSTPSLLLAEWLPLHIRLQDFPGLRSLAWQVREGLEVVTPREAFGLYERNWRHLDETALAAHERALVRALQQVFQGGVGDV